MFEGLTTDTHISILSSRGTLVNFSLLIAGNKVASGRFVLPAHTVWACI